MPLVVYAPNGGTLPHYRYRIPALAKTQAGTLLAFAEGRVDTAADQGNIDIVLRRSTDGGATWGPMITVLSHGTDVAGNPCVVVDPASGDVVLLSCRCGGADTWGEIASGTKPARRVYVQRSSDDGVTWTAPVEITSQVRPSYMRWYATGPGHGVAITEGPHAGRLVIPCNHTKAPASGSGDTGSEAKYCGGHAIYSDDGGHTWTLGFVSSNPSGDINEDEATVCEIPGTGGRLYFNCREGGGIAAGNRADAYSSNGGQTLNLSYRVNSTIVGAICQGSVAALPDGRLLYTGPSWPSDTASNRGAVALRVSTDQGATWRIVEYLTGLPSGYSDMAVLDPFTVAVLYECGDWVNSAMRLEFTQVTIPPAGCCH
jgi:sialidase-1